MIQPPILSATPATDQDVRSLIAASSVFGRFLLAMPASTERDQAALLLNEAVLWAHQAIQRGAASQNVIVADKASLPA